MTHTITQKHYAPWVLERQQRLAARQREAWANMGVEENRHCARAHRRQRSRNTRRHTSFQGRTSGSAAPRR
jgi:hypothetical protein